MKFSKTGAVVVAAMLIMAAPSAAQTVTVDAARGIVVRQYPNVTIVSNANERFNNRDLYVFRVTGSELSGERQLYVDRSSGMLYLTRSTIPNGVDNVQTAKTAVECKAGHDPGETKCKQYTHVLVNGKQVARVKTTEKCEPNALGGQTCEVKRKVKH